MTIELRRLPAEPPTPVRALRVLTVRWWLLSARQLTEAVAALLLVVLLSPVLLAVAIAVKLSSPGPVLFRQERLGLHRRRFRIIKFRTMIDGNSDEIHRRYVRRLLTEDTPPDGGQAGVYKLTTDPRVTRVGSFLRRTSLDELPQLWNVVRGELSLVGPRPVLAWEAELFGEGAEPRFAVRPGITGLWQVSGRSTVDYKAALELDVRYAHTKSLWLDLRILARTVRVVLDRSVAR
ncbi:MAG: sugar transferase [Micromonosporaceae bacterium]